MTLFPLSVLRCFVESRLVFCNPLTSVVDADAESGLGGRLLTRVLGGAGKAPMLVVLRKVLPGVGNADMGGELDVAELDAEWTDALAKAAVFSVGTAGVVFAFASRGVGRPDAVTERRGVVAPGVGMPDAAEPGRGASSGTSGRGLRVFAIGSAGRGPVGGGCGGRELVRVGSAEVMMAVVVTDIGMRLPGRPSPRAARVRPVSPPPSSAPVPNVFAGRIGCAHRKARSSMPACMCSALLLCFWRSRVEGYMRRPRRAG